LKRHSPLIFLKMRFAFMSTVSLSQTFASKVVDPITEQNGRKCCSIGSCAKKVFDLTAAVFAGIGNWPFYQTHGGRLSSWNTFLKVCEGSSRFLFSLNNFQLAYAKISEQKEVIVPTEIALKD